MSNVEWGFNFRAIVFVLHTVYIIPTYKQFLLNIISENCFSIKNVAAKVEFLKIEKGKEQKKPSRHI